MSHEDRDKHEALVRRADELRHHLLLTIDELDRRRHELTDVPLQLRRHPAATGIAGLAVAGALVGTIVFIVERLRHRTRDRWRERAAAITRTWQHPERVASGKQGPFVEELGRKVLLGTLAFAGVELGKRLVSRLVATRT